MIRRALTAGLALALTIAAPATAQVDVVPPIPPCPWWDCGSDADVVVEEYRVDAVIVDGIATTTVREVLRNDSDFLAEGTFLFPIPADAAVTGLTLWIDGEPVSGEILDGDTARRTYEEIIRRTIDPALLEFVDDGLLRLEVFPIPAGESRAVEIEYRQALAADAGLVRYRHPFGAEHNVEIEDISARIEIRASGGLKAVHSPTHGVAIDRLDPSTAVVGYEASGGDQSELIVYYSTDAGPVSLDVVTYAEDGEGWFVMLMSPGIAPAAEVAPKDVVLVLDTSGSMEGEKFDQAQDAARFVLDNLNEGDRFDVIGFSTGIDVYAGDLRPVEEASAARTWVGRLSAGGSTNIDLALGEAFALADPGRPLYLIFLTDGLPTEGITDTGEILERLHDRRSETTSVFVFGVGYDVDTVLLDSIARDHHGTSTYVGPGEEIDRAVEALYSKVASPVMTGIAIDVDGVQVTDLHPSALPDVFSGGQLVLTGRYEGSGDARITVSGKVKGEQMDLHFDDVTFAAAGGDDTVPRLWATRKIGDLLRRVRLDGPDEETIDQIVRLSIRWGIVTPYTSYLVTEDAPFGEEAIDEIARSAADAAQANTIPPSGEAAFEAADTAADLSESDVSSEPGGEYADLVRVAGGRTFRLVDGVWMDTTFDPEMTPVRVPFGSDDYFTLAGSDAALAQALTVGPAVVVVHGGVAYEIVGADLAGDELPDLTTTTLSPLAVSEDASTDDGDVPAPVIIGALVAALAAAAALVRRSLKG